MWGNYQEVNGWAGYTWFPGFTTTARANFNVQSPIVGADGWIIGKIQVADPNFYGGKRIELFGGASLDGKLLGFSGVSLLVEGGIPVYQNLDGPQLAKAWQATAALRWKIDDQPAPAAAPDLLSRKGPQVFAASPVASWNGLYLGLNGGYTWNGDNATKFNYAGSGGGFVGIHEADSDLVLQLKAAQGQFGRLKLENGNELTETFYLYGLLVAGGVPSQVVIGFSSTQIKKYKAFMTRYMGIQYPNQDGKMVRPPLWAHRWKLSTAYEQKGTYSWYGWRIALVEEPASRSLMKTSDPLYQFGKEFYNALKEGAAKVDYSQAGADDGEKKDEVPF